MLHRTFDCDLKIVDAIMGSGKTEAIINMINNSNPYESNYLVITPYKSEIERFKTKCINHQFIQPSFDPTKLDNIKKLLGAGKNIVSTHALFSRFDNECIDICRANNYTLIMDEVADVVQEYHITKDDYNVLIDKFVYIDEETNALVWKEEYENYNGKFNDIKRLCELGSLAYYGGSIMIWLFPIEVFNSFRDIYILTYKFYSQVQRYYYDYYGLKYSYLYVKGSDYGEYEITSDPSLSNNTELLNYKTLIHVLDNEKLNSIGDRENDLSKSWYYRNNNNGAMRQLQKNIQNYFRNIRQGIAKDNIWTTFKDYKTQLKGKSYTKGFIPLNSRATNEYRDRTSIAYPINRFLDPYIKNFFVNRGVTVDEDGYALSEMLQFIWRSAIRDNNEIWVYIPSIRMRTLLLDWMDEIEMENTNLNKNNIVIENTKSAI